MFWRWTGGTSQWTDPRRERCICRWVRVNMLISLLSDSRPWAKGVAQLQGLMVHNGVFTSIMSPCQWNSEIKIEYTGFLGCPNVTFVGTSDWYMCPLCKVWRVTNILTFSREANSECNKHAARYIANVLPSHSARYIIAKAKYILQKTPQSV